VPLEYEVPLIPGTNVVKLHPLFQRKCLSNEGQEEVWGGGDVVASSVSAQVPLEFS